MQYPQQNGGGKYTQDLNDTQVSKKEVDHDISKKIKSNNDKQQLFNNHFIDSI